ncbi:redox-sensitive transcriptional activator SoxR [bacterium]|nr:MAG: redox-sensitive transcriptional activator SoxR [bacterium]
MENNENDMLSVGELSRRSGVAISAIHFYESKGLIQSLRNQGNQRRFPRGVLRIIAYIKVAQRLGFSLEEIKAAFSTLPQDKPPTIEDWENMSRAWEEELTSRIDLLTRVKKQLNACIGCGCLSLKECPLRNPNDELAQQGPGPHLF